MNNGEDEETLQLALPTLLSTPTHSGRNVHEVFTGGTLQMPPQQTANNVYAHCPVEVVPCQPSRIDVSQVLFRDGSM